METRLKDCIQQDFYICAYIVHIDEMHVSTFPKDLSFLCFQSGALFDK